MVAMVWCVIRLGEHERRKQLPVSDFVGGGNFLLERASSTEMSPTLLTAYWVIRALGRFASHILRHFLYCKYFYSQLHIRIVIIRIFTYTTYI